MKIMLGTAVCFLKLKNAICLNCRAVISQRRFYSKESEKKYTEVEKEKILQVINNSKPEDLAGYDITKGRLKKFSQWKNNNGQVKTLSDIELIDGFSEKTAKKLFSSILEGPPKVAELSNKIKGQILHPYLSDSARQNSKSILSVNITVNSVCWTLIDKKNYEVVEWVYQGINYPDSKKLQITDILDIAWKITRNLPNADIYVMKGEATTLRAAGSDPNNPKVISVNLQKAQMVAMIVALINARSYHDQVHDLGESEKDVLTQKVYFLRPTLPYRLFGTLVGKERVSTDQTVEMLLQNCNERSSTNSHVYVPDKLKAMFRSQKDLQKDMLGQCLLLGITFIDICIYKNQESITKLATREK